MVSAVPSSKIVLGPGGFPQAVLIQCSSAAGSSSPQRPPPLLRVKTTRGINSATKFASESMEDQKHESRIKKRSFSSKGPSNVQNPSGVGATASYDLESETIRLNDLASRLKEYKFWVPVGGDSMAVLHKLVDCAFLLLRAVFEAIDKERTRLTNAGLKTLARAHKENQAAIIQEMTVQHERKIVSINSERDREAQERAALIEGLTSQQEMTLEALEKEKEKVLCQICFVNPRDAVVLTCMHYLYCNACLEAQKVRSNRCPTCRGVMSGICRLNI